MRACPVLAGTGSRPARAPRLPWCGSSRRCRRGRPAKHVHPRTRRDSEPRRHGGRGTGPAAALVRRSRAADPAVNCVRPRPGHFAAGMTPGYGHSSWLSAAPAYRQRFGVIVSARFLDHVGAGRTPRGQLGEDRRETRSQIGNLVLDPWRYFSVVEAPYRLRRARRPVADRPQGRRRPGDLHRGPAGPAHPQSSPAAATASSPGRRPEDRDHRRREADHGGDVENTYAALAAQFAEGGSGDAEGPLAICSSCK